MQMPQVTISIASNRTVKPQTTQSLLELVAHGGFDFHIAVAEHGYTIAENRTVLAIQAIKNESEYLLFIDDDMVFPADTLEILVKHNKDIVGPAYRSRKADSRKLVHLDDKIIDLDKESYKELIPCRAKGAGVLLIKVNVFNKVERPWFNFTYLDSGECRVGEDWFFCNMVKDAGDQTWCDLVMGIGNLAIFTYR